MECTTLCTAPIRWTASSSIIQGNKVLPLVRPKRRGHHWALWVFPRDPEARKDYRTCNRQKSPSEEKVYWDNETSWPHWGLKSLRKPKVDQMLGQTRCDCDADCRPDSSPCPRDSQEHPCCLGRVRNPTKAQLGSGKRGGGAASLQEKAGLGSCTRGWRCLTKG